MVNTIRDRATDRNKQGCNICGNCKFSQIAKRSDDRTVVQCESCGLGVLEILTSDRKELGDIYARHGENVSTDVNCGNNEYASLDRPSWVGALIKLLCHSGSVLDIGCADGQLLFKLGENYTGFGIEANKKMASIAESKGITIIGADITALDIAQKHLGSFDLVASIGVFEHLRDFRVGFENALRMLKEGGVLLFQVPLISCRVDNSALFQSSLEHVWYPTERALRQLVEDGLGWRLHGTEIHIPGSRATYLGIAFHDQRKAGEIDHIISTVLTRAKAPSTRDERLARMHVGMIHAAITTREDIEALTEFPVDQLSSTMMRRLADLWIADLERIAAAERQIQAHKSSIALKERRIHELEGNLNALANDATQNQFTLTKEIINLNERQKRAAASIENDGPVSRPVAKELPHNNAAVDSTAKSNFSLSDSDAALMLTRVDASRQEMPLVSVIITSFNYGQFVVDAVESVLNQTMSNVEIVVVEGGSSDEFSRLRVSQLDRRRVRVLMQGVPTKAGANRNYGINQARGKYICCLDADDLLRPTYLEKAVYLLERFNFDVVSSALEMFGADSGIVGIAEKPDLEMLIEGNHVLTCAVFRRELWQQAGGYRDVEGSTGHVHEDWAFWLRLGALGARFINMASDPLLLYRVHKKSLSRGKDVHGPDRQREIVNALNADVITPQSREMSQRQNKLGPATPLELPPAIPIHSAENDGTKHRPTILLAMPFLLLGGAERLLSALMDQLTSQGWGVVVLTSIDPGTTSGDTTSWFENFTKDIFHLPKFLPQEYWGDFLQHIVESRHVDILWIAGSAFAYDNLRYLKNRFHTLKVVDIIFNIVGHTENNIRRRDLIDLVFVEDASVGRWLIEHGQLSNKINLVESGVDLVRLNPSLRSDTIREELLRDSDRLLVGFCGRWSIEKDPLFFIEIAKRAVGRLPVRFVMTGAGPLEASIKAAIAAAKFPPGSFQLLGNVPDISALIASIDLLIVPSRVDGRPVVVMEAMAVGTPVAASDVGSLSKLIRHGETGWICEAGNIDQFLASIEAAATDRVDLSNKRSAARAYAEKHLDISRMFNDYTRALVELCKE